MRWCVLIFRQTLFFSLVNMFKQILRSCFLRCDIRLRPLFVCRRVEWRCWSQVRGWSRAVSTAVSLTTSVSLLPSSSPGCCAATAQVTHQCMLTLSHKTHSLSLPHTWKKHFPLFFFRFKPYPNCHPTNPYNQQFLAKRFFFSTQRKSLTLLAAHPYREMQSFLYQKIRTI